MKIKLAELSSSFNNLQKEYTAVSKKTPELDVELSTRVYLHNIQKKHYEDKLSTNSLIQNNERLGTELESVRKKNISIKEGLRLSQQKVITLENEHKISLQQEKLKELEETISNMKAKPIITDENLQAFINAVNAKAEARSRYKK